jgi:CDP-paratose 2-epimerase
MKVLVTGGCGFIGSHACEYYAKKGNEVISYDNMTKHELARTGYATELARNYNWNYLKKLGVKLLKEDIRDKKTLMEVAKKCDFIIHTAAQPAMTISCEDPELDITTNVIGTFNVLECARKFKIPVVSCATIHVYGNKINETLKEGKTRYIRNPAEINEEHPILEGTLTPLHASKMAGDSYVKVYIDTYKVEAASFRLTGLYGPRQFGGEDHGWVANFSIRAVLNKPITIYGTGKQVRDILYATDVISAFDSFYKTRKSGIYNIGGGKENSISLLECIELIEEILEKKINVKYEPSRHGDLQYFICDISKARKELKWQPKVKPKEGVRKLIQWIKQNLHLFIA